jgi:hypothetical protein
MEGFQGCFILSSFRKDSVSKEVMTLFKEGNTVSNNKLIFPVALKTIIIKYNKYNFKQYIHIHNKISQSAYNEYNVIIIRYFVSTLNNLYISF